MFHFLTIVGVLQILAGLAVALLGPTVIHQTFGAVLFGFGVLSLGTAAIVDRLERLHRD
ncbi:hypothetical protein [Rhizobium sp. Rhizsp82]|uniref:hypothetical protein n=1 Tax=Rhizobium sp. Rhizsp82 TaxID=3243057 RepID=UPI0039B48E3D